MSQSPRDPARSRPLMQPTCPTAGHFPEPCTTYAQLAGNPQKAAWQAPSRLGRPADDCRNRAQRCKKTAPESYKPSTLDTSSIRRLLTSQCGPVTFRQAVQLIAQPCTMETFESSQTKRRLEQGFYAVFTDRHTLLKKNQRALAVCARLLHPPLTSSATPH